MVGFNMILAGAGTRYNVSANYYNPVFQLQRTYYLTKIICMNKIFKPVID
jgi:hypothetical protein